MQDYTALFYALGMHAEIVREGNSFSADRAKHFAEEIEKFYWARWREIQASQKHGDY